MLWRAKSLQTWGEIDVCILVAGGLSQNESSFLAGGVQASVMKRDMEWAGSQKVTK